MSLNLKRIDFLITPLEAHRLLLHSTLRLIDVGVTQLKAHGPSRTCIEGKKEEEEEPVEAVARDIVAIWLTSFKAPDPPAAERMWHI